MVDNFRCMVSEFIDKLLVLFDRYLTLLAILSVSY